MKLTYILGLDLAKHKGRPCCAAERQSAASGEKDLPVRAAEVRMGSRLNSGKENGVASKGRVAQIGLSGKKKVPSWGDVLRECSHHDGTTEERAAAL